MAYPYQLEKYNGLKTKHTCPSCKTKHKFTRYIYSDTLEYIASNVGRCDREDNCGYHYKPRQYFIDNNIETKKDYVYTKHKTGSKHHSLIQKEIYSKSLSHYHENNFIAYLQTIFDIDIVNNLIQKYHIGTSKCWEGATVFWQVDIYDNVRTGKVMLYDIATGKRVKKPFIHINWVHKILEIENYELQQCFFGEHLLKDKIKPIAVCESEKTAIIASVYYPMYIWLAAGGLDGLNAHKTKILQGRNVTLFPDLTPVNKNKLTSFDKWVNKAEQIKSIANIDVTDILEHISTEDERKQGLDIADYLVKYDYKNFKGL